MKDETDHEKLKNLIVLVANGNYAVWLVLQLLQKDKDQINKPITKLLDKHEHVSQEIRNSNNSKNTSINR